MENLAPPYIFILSLIQDLESGVSARLCVQNYLKRQCDGFTPTLALWLQSVEVGHTQFQSLREELPTFRRAIFDLLDYSLQGVSILDPARSLEIEMREFSELQLEKHLAKLPFTLMLPVLFLQFPALLMLILGPLVFYLIKEVQ